MGKKRKLKRWMRNPDIKFVSLCRQPRNRVKGVYKSATKGRIEMPVHLNADEEGELKVLVTAPNEVDIDGEALHPDDVKAGMISWARNGFQTDLDHSLEPLDRDKITPYQMFQVQEGDSRFEGIEDMEGNAVDPVGGWGLIYQIDDPDLRKLVREEGWVGASLYGDVDLEPVAEDEPVAVAKSDPQGGQTMDEEKLAAALAKALGPLFQVQNTTISETVAKSITEATTAATADEGGEGEADPFEFEGNPFSKRDLKRHMDKLRRTMAKKSLKLNTLEGLLEQYKSLPEDADEDVSDELSVDDEVAQILGRKSNQNRGRTRVNKSVDHIDDEILAGMAEFASTELAPIQLEPGNGTEQKAG